MAQEEAASERQPPAPTATEELPDSSRRRTYYCYMLVGAQGTTTYIGASTDPWRRLRQHNGNLAGGARATRASRPWQLRIVVTGFLVWREALRFEWAWKHGACRKRIVRGVAARTSRSADLVRERSHLILTEFSAPVAPLAPSRRRVAPELRVLRVLRT